MREITGRVEPDIKETIQKTLMTALLFDGFWDRWIAHGLDRETICHLRRNTKTLDHWIEVLRAHAREHEVKAIREHEQAHLSEAEKLYRIAGLHYQLIQWIFPCASDEKRTWFSCSKDLFRRADSISQDKILETLIQVDGRECFGRIRIPQSPKGCIVIVNPIDSAKEELFTYEMQFADRGFVTVSFDGPGQGETYVVHQCRAAVQSWDVFVNQVIAYASQCFPELSIYLFGTSSGAVWAIHGSSHESVKKAVAVSPACVNDVKLPDYFTERLFFILEDAESTLIPDLQNFDHYSPVFLFHGKDDVMVKDEDIHNLFQKLPTGKRLVEYDGEGHCCNFKLPEVRQISMEWFLEDEE